MPDVPDVQSLLRAAEQAAAAGDHPSAERLLREAAAVQEATLGPHHPDLAGTLNNLGVVCEMADNPIDAEHYFRRACTIATTSLAPDHPFVATSRRNLEDFCASRGKPVKLPGAAAAGAAAVDASSDALYQFPEDRRTAAPAAAGRRARRPTRLIVGTALAIGLLLAVVAALRTRSEERAASPIAPTVAAGAQAVAPGPQDTAAARSQPPAESVTDVSNATLPQAPQAGTISTAGQEGEAAHSSGAPAAGAGLGVVTADLCRSLATGRQWRCVPPEEPVGAGPLFFYTRVKSPSPITLQHRWYRDDREHRIVNLPIRANMLDGYRTYSRQTVDARGTASWRVELTTPDGTVLRETRFVVR